nr:MAG TPA_asm: hypothetical protein [Bacteriophage sp.]
MEQTSIYMLPYTSCSLYTFLFNLFKIFGILSFSQ